MSILDNLTDKEIAKRLTTDKAFRSYVANELVDLRKQNIIKFDDNRLNINHEKQSYINYYNQYILPIIEANNKQMIESIKLNETKEREFQMLTKDKDLDIEKQKTEQIKLQLEIERLKLNHK